MIKFATPLFRLFSDATSVNPVRHTGSVSYYHFPISFKPDDRTCSAITSHFEHFEGHLMKFANLQFEISYKYLLLAAQFDSYTKDRPGFHAKFQALSDRSWAAGQEIIKYVTKRGANFEFENQNELNAGLSDLNEFQAMATVLDTEKYLFEKARLTHKGYSHSDAHKHYDPEAAHYIEEEYLQDLADSVRKYSGFANDLKNLYSNSKDINMDNYLFDQYLQKV